MDAYYINVSDVNYNDIDFLFKFVDKAKREKALKFVHKKDCLRTLIGDILVRIYICKNYSYKNEQLKFKFNEFKKPFIDNNKNINFNISHSGDYIAVAFDNESIGIDVEEIKNIEYDEIIKSFFSESEKLWFKSIKSSDKKKEFYRLWTLKESYVKFKGKGLSIPFDSFALDMNSQNNIYKLEKSLENICFENYNIDGKYELSLCSHKKQVNLKEIKYKDIMENINYYL